MEPSDNFSRLLAEVILKNEIIIEQISDQKKIHVRSTFQSTLGKVTEMTVELPRYGNGKVTSLP